MSVRNRRPAASSRRAVMRGGCAWRLCRTRSAAEQRLQASRVAGEGVCGADDHLRHADLECDARQHRVRAHACAAAKKSQRSSARPLAWRLLQQAARAGDSLGNPLAFSLPPGSRRRPASPASARPLHATAYRRQGLYTRHLQPSRQSRPADPPSYSLHQRPTDCSSTSSATRSRSYSLHKHYPRLPASEAHAAISLLHLSPPASCYGRMSTA